MLDFWGCIRKKTTEVSIFNNINESVNVVSPREKLGSLELVELHKVIGILRNIRILLVTGIIGGALRIIGPSNGRVNEPA